MQLEKPQSGHTTLMYHNLTYASRTEMLCAEVADDVARYTLRYNCSLYRMATGFISAELSTLTMVALIILYPAFAV